jgi:hypothetical protein
LPLDRYFSQQQVELAENPITCKDATVDTLVGSIRRKEIEGNELALIKSAFGPVKKWLIAGWVLAAIITRSPTANAYDGIPLG